MSEQQEEYIIPKNYSEGRSFRGHSYRNIIEGVIGAVIVWRIVQATPFVSSIKLTAGVILAAIMLLVGIFGIRDESISQFIGSYILYRRDKKKYHMRRTNYVPKKQREKTERDKDYERRKANGELTKAEQRTEKIEAFKEEAKQKVYSFIQGDYKKKKPAED